MIVSRSDSRSGKCLSAPRTVLTIGNFDGVHLGHTSLLDRIVGEARQFGLAAAVLTFNPHPREFFSPDQAPACLTTLREKLELIRDHGVDYCCVLPFNAAMAALTAEEFIERILVQRLNVARLVIGDDFRFGARRAGDFALLCQAGERYGFVVEAMPSVVDRGQRISSSAVREALARGALPQAEALLGRPYAMDGVVVHGRKLGRTLGFATANIYIRHSPLPLSGVFAVEVLIPGRSALPGVANLGFRPTIGSFVRPILEIHLLDFAEDIYGAHINVRFLKKIRDEMKFSGLDELKARIALDVENARAIFKQ